MNVLYFILLVLVVVVVYNLVPSKQTGINAYHMGKKFEDGKPILWMHVAGEVNARHWLNFYSRNTTELNQPYLYLTMKSVYDKCGTSFNVCLIDDDAFKTLPGWDHDVSSMASPEKERYRQLGLAKLLHHNGGFLVPNSFLCLKDLRSFYSANLSDKGAFAVCTGKTDATGTAVPSPLFMGCRKGSEVMEGFIKLSESRLNDNVSEFGDELAKHCRKFTVHDGKLTGSKKCCGGRVELQDLLGTGHLDFHKDSVGVYFPADDLLKRPAYGWFARMSSEQLVRSELFFCKLLLSSY